MPGTIPRRFGRATPMIAIILVLGLVAVTAQPGTARAQDTEEPDETVEAEPNVPAQAPPNLPAPIVPIEDSPPPQGVHLGTTSIPTLSRGIAGETSGPLGDAVAAGAPGFYRAPYRLPVFRAVIGCATACYGYPSIDFNSVETNGELAYAYPSGAGQVFFYTYGDGCTGVGVAHNDRGDRNTYYENLNEIWVDNGQWVDPSVSLGLFGGNTGCGPGWLHFSYGNPVSGDYLPLPRLFACHGPERVEYPDEAGYSIWDTAAQNNAFVFDDNLLCLYRTCNGQRATIDMNRTGSGVGTPGNDVIVGTSGNDSIQGGGGDDIICGGNGNDTITGEAGRDWIDAGGGNDVVFGGSEIDRIYGRAGADTIHGDGGSDRIYAGSGDDTVNAGSGADRVFGGPGNDTLNGQGGQDFMKGEGGNDTMQGNHQSDDLFGGPGNDTLRGAQGRDVIFGESGNDRMFGGDNTDYLDGGPGNDYADGQRGKDNPIITNRSGCRAEVRVSC